MDRGPIRTLIADDHAIFRYGLRKLLEAESGFQVVGEAADGEEAVKLAGRLKPHLLLLDLAMARRPGLEALREIAALPAPVPRTIILAAAVEKQQIVEALQLGARGVVLKESAAQLLFESIRCVMSGQYWVERKSVSDLVQALSDFMRLSSPEARQNFGISPRELEIVARIAAGCSNKEIAREFSLSERTVKHHLTNIFDKVGVSNRLELALFAVNHGLVPSD